MSLKVGIILVNYNGWKDTLECVESLLKLDYLNFNIIIVDNNSTDGSLGQIEKWASGENEIKFLFQKTNKWLEKLVYPLASKPLRLNILKEDFQAAIGELPKITLIESSTNRGFAGGNNLGIKLGLRHFLDFFWLLNNDTIVPPNALKELVNYYQFRIASGEKLGLLGSKLNYYHYPEKLQAVIGMYRPLFALGRHFGQNEEDRGQYKKVEINQLNYVVGAAMFLPKGFVQEVGFMAEDYFLYYEEIDWVRRGAQKKYTIDVCLKATVYHKEGASVGNGRDNNHKSFISDIYSVRNRILITKRYYKKYLIPVYFSLLFVILNRIKRKQFNRIKPILKVFIQSFNLA